MVKINIKPDCGNSPRKVFLKDLYTSFAYGNFEILYNNVEENLNWIVAGQSALKGKENYIKEIARHKLWKAKEITVDTIITHGAEASVSGTIKATDNLKYVFCDIYKFKGAGGTTITSIMTFLVQQD